MLRRADVFISVHGADMINGLLLRPGASVIEVMPVQTRGCPCTMYRDMFNAPHDSRIYHYALEAANASMAGKPIRRIGYNSDLFVRWADLACVLEHIRDSRHYDNTRHDAARRCRGASGGKWQEGRRDAGSR